MEMPIRGYNNQPTIGSNEVILNSLNPAIRLFNSSRNVSNVPSTKMSGFWRNASPANTGNFSATAYYFAKKIQSIIGVPIGLIVNAWGGSNVESWIDSTTLATYKKIEIPANIPYNQAHITPTIMYNTMLHPYIGYTIKGIIWYQGEGNRRNPEQYQSLFSLMINSWRQQWQQGSFPFYFVQIAPFGENNNISGALVREAQLKTMQTLENTGMAVTMDIGEKLLVHPAQKELVGSRLAYWALSKNYNIPGIAFCGPVYDKIERNRNDTIVLSFKYAEMGLNSFGKPLTDFEIAGEDKKFYPANAMFTRGKPEWISVWSDSVKNPISVRYGFKNWVQGSLYNIQGLPASSFRTDDW
jgi:sialate O-acetylesterase